GLDCWVVGDEHHAGTQQFVRDLNRVSQDNPALWALDHYPDGFAWIDANDAGGNVLSFLRFAGDSPPPDSAVPPDGSASAPGSPAPPGGPAAPPDGRGAAGPPGTPGIPARIVNLPRV